MNANNDVKDFVVKFNPSMCDVNRLRTEIDELPRVKPDILIDYLCDPLHEKTDDDQLNWNQDYFFKQKKLTELNFSRKRLIHLVDVIEYGRFKGWKGFTVRTEVEAYNSTKSFFTNYRPSISIETSVNEKDLMGVRIGLSLEFANKSLGGADLREALRWAKMQFPNLCEPYVEKDFSGPIDQNKDHWNSDYFFIQMVYLKTSFTEERFLHMVDVRDDLRERGEEGFAPVLEQAREEIKVNTPKTDSVRRSPLDNETTEPPRPPADDPDRFNNLWLVLGAIAATGAVALLLLLLAQR